MKNSLRAQRPHAPKLPVISPARLFGWIASVIIRHPKLILAIMIVFCIVALYTSTFIPEQSMSDEYMDKTSFDGITYDNYNDRFVSDTYIILIQSSHPTDYTLLHDILIISEEIQRLPHVSHVDSVAGLITGMYDGYLPDNQHVIDEALHELPQETLSEFIPDSQTSLMFISLSPGVSTDTSQTVVPYVMDVITSASLPPGVSIELTGNTPYDMQVETAMMNDFSVLIIGSMALMLLVLSLLFSNMRFWILPIVLLTFGLIFTFGVMGLLGIPANDGATAAFPILLGLGIDYAVQFHARFDEERRVSALHQAIRETITNTGPSVLYAMVATCMGFVAMLITPIPMIQTFGVVAILGVICCYVSALFGFGSLAILLTYAPKEKKNGITDRLMDGYGNILSLLATKITSIAVPVIIFSVLIAFIGISYDGTIPIDTSTKSMTPPDLPAQLVFDKVEAVSGSMLPLPLYITGGDVISLPTVQWLDLFGSGLVRDHPEITDVSGLSLLIRQYNNGDIPKTEAELTRVLSHIPVNEKMLYLQGDASVMVLSTIALTVNEQRTLKSKVMEDATWFEPPAGLSITPTGDFSLYTLLIDTIEKAKDQMTILGFILIFLFLLVAYRKPVALSPLVPLICIVGWNPVAMILMGQNYNVMTAVLGSMTIGVGSEYTILVMERYLEEHKKTRNKTLAISQAVKKIGSAITVSGLVTASGFAALLISSFPILSSFGISTVIAVVFSLIGAICIMPAALILFVSVRSIPDDNA